MYHAALERLLSRRPSRGMHGVKSSPLRLLAHTEYAGPTRLSSRVARLTTPL